MEGGSGSATWPFWLKVLSPRCVKKRGSEFLLVAGMAAAGGTLFPSWTQLPTIATVTDAITWFGMDMAAWNLWVTQVGDTQDDLRLLAALPKNAVTGACGIAAQNGNFTVLHATQVGLIWRLAKMVMSQRAGLRPEEHVDADPWETSTSTPAPGTSALTSTSTPGVKESVVGGPNG